MTHRSFIYASVAAVSICAALIYGCGDDDTSPAPVTMDGGNEGGGSTSSSSSSSSSSSGSSNTDGCDAASADGPPVLGAQVDRVGRPLVNIMFNHVFDSDDGARAIAQNTYNTDAKEEGWVTAYREEIAKNLALFDGFDGKCGDNLGADAGASNTTAIARYAVLADIYADDRLWFDLRGGLDTPTYFRIEQDELKHDSAGYVGGRNFGTVEDWVDRTYSLSIAGLGAVLTYYQDGVQREAFTPSAPFPFLNPP